MVTILRERKSTSLSRDKKGELQLKLEEKPKVSDEELTQFFLEKNGSFTVKDAIYLVHGSNIDKRFKRIEELGNLQKLNFLFKSILLIEKV